MRVLSWSNFIHQPSGYGVVQRNVLPYIQENSSHEVVQLAQSGVQNSMPFEVHGIKVYPSSFKAGRLSCADVPPVVEREDIDLVLPQLDLWANSENVVKTIQAVDVPVVPYAPIHTDPLAPNWHTILNEVNAVIPYCEFGERVIKTGDIDEEAVLDPIYHGVDSETFHPLDDGDVTVVDIPEDTFVVGLFKNLQGTRAAHERMIRAFASFLDHDSVDDAMLYVHCAKTPKDSWEIEHLIERAGLDEQVMMPAEAEYLWGMPEAGLNQMYNACDVLLNTVRTEGFGLPILEAAAAGVPAIGGAFSAMPELIAGQEGEVRYDEMPAAAMGDDGGVISADRGWLVPTWDREMTTGKHAPRRRYNVKHIANALLHVYRNPDETAECGAAAREFAVQHSWADKAEQFIDVFDAIEDGALDADTEDGSVASDVEKRLSNLGYTG
jgi:glycosyltransferase involved in cell wall biosynthesis